MLLKLRIFFTILSAICIAAILPVGSFFSWYGAMGCALAAGAFFVLMLLCKQSQELRELQKQEPKGDFLSKKEPYTPDFSNPDDK